MNNPPDPPETPRQRHQKEYEDCHFHDEDESVPSDDFDKGGKRPPVRRRYIRKPPPRRSYDED